MIIYINTLDRSENLLNILRINIKNDQLLSEKTMEICSKYNKKNILVWTGISGAGDYLDRIKSKSFFCWFYIMYELFNTTLTDYDVQFLCHSDDLNIAQQSEEIFHKNKK